MSSKAPGRLRSGSTSSRDADRGSFLGALPTTAAASSEGIAIPRSRTSSFEFDSKEKATPLSIQSQTERWKSISGSVTASDLDSLLRTSRNRSNSFIDGIDLSFLDGMQSTGSRSHSRSNSFDIRNSRAGSFDLPISFNGSRSGSFDVPDNILLDGSYGTGSFGSSSKNPFSTSNFAGGGSNNFQPFSMSGHDFSSDDLFNRSRGNSLDMNNLRQLDNVMHGFNSNDYFSGVNYSNDFQNKTGIGDNGQFIFDDNNEKTKGKAKNKNKKYKRTNSNDVEVPQGGMNGDIMFSSNHNHNQRLQNQSAGGSVQYSSDVLYGSNSMLAYQMPSLGMSASMPYMFRTTSVHTHSDNPNSNGYVGTYSPGERRKRIEKFLEKRNRRVWTKKVKYDVRKNFADSRLRIKGRFVKKEEESVMRSNGLIN